MSEWKDIKRPFREALISGFDWNSLARVLQFHCDRRLDRITSKSEGFDRIVDNVIADAVRNGWLEKLAQGALEENETHGDLETTVLHIVAGVESEGNDYYQGAPDDPAKHHYLQVMIKKADNELSGEPYVDLAVQAAQTRPVIETPNEAAQPMLERKLRVFKNRSHGLKDNTAQSKTIDSFDGLYDFVREEKHVALIGDPGSGKTTTLWQLARSLALAATEDPDTPIPLFVELSKVGDAGLEELLEAELAKYGLALHEYLPDWIFLLLDGLNEMPRKHSGTLTKWLEKNADVPTVVTCRKLDYFAFRLPLNRVDIAPFDVDRIYQYIQRAPHLYDKNPEDLFWQLAGEKTQEAWKWWQTWGSRTVTAEEQGDDFHRFWHGKIEEAKDWEKNKLYVKQLQDELRQNEMRQEEHLPGLLGIATNPYFLGWIIVPIFHYIEEGRLSESRGQLIAEFAGQLLERNPNTSEETSPVEIYVDPLPDALAGLAYQMQSEHTGTIVDFEWAKETLTTSLPELDTKDVLDRAAKSHILDVVPEETVRFSHQLLQEYFAALKLDESIEDGAKAEEYWPGDKWWMQTGWEESAVLLAGLRGDATSLVKWLMPVQPTLAHRCATESGATCDATVLQQLYEPAEGARVSPEARFEWGKLLAAKGDKRPGVGLDSDGLPDIDWCDVEAGEFLFRRSEQKRTLPAFKIARYPVTVMQFQAFLGATDGFDNPAWWQGLPGSTAGKPELRFNYANHPHDHVNWYDAIAFCRWLSDKRDRNITLPTEQQWEKAARGTNGRPWPWGTKYRVGYANIDERDEKFPIGPTFLNSTTAVGLYPWGKSPCGAMDMCGNVWEWCLNDADDPDGTSMGDPSAGKELRGGSWNNYIHISFTHHRYSVGFRTPWPGYRNWRVGFRVVMLD